MQLKYKCLILDHDDTCVDSTPSIHYPSYVEIMKTMRPDARILSIDEFRILNHEHRFIDYYKNELNFSEDDMKEEHKIWRSYTDRMIPKFFPGFIDFIKKFRSYGGIITIATHSDADVVITHYKKAGILVPELIYGWDYKHKEKMKPSPWIVEDIMKHYNLEKSNIAVLDDLNTGIKMAKTIGITALGAGWAHNVNEIRSFMEKNCDYFFNDIKEFTNFIFTEK